VLFYFHIQREKGKIVPVRSSAAADARWIMINVTVSAYLGLLFATGLALLLAGLGFIFLRTQTAPRRFVACHATAIMWGSAILMAGLWWLLGVLRYQGLHTSLIDTGTFTNVLWNTVHGKIMGTAISWSTHFTQHFSPSLILVALLYAPWQNPEWLIGLTALCVASGGPAVFYLARKLDATPGSALILSVLWLFSNLVRMPLLADFHETLLAAPVLLWVGYFAVAKKPVPALLLALVALGFKEDMPVYVFSLGIVLAWSLDEKRTGWAISALAVIYYAMVNLWLWSVITPMHLDFLAIRFPQLASQPGGIWASILSNPTVLIAPMLHWEHLWVMLMLFMPVLFLPFLRWGALGLIPSLWLMLSLAPFSVMILSGHYHLPIFALIVLAAIAGYLILVKRKPACAEMAKWGLLSFTLCFTFAFPTAMIANIQLNPGFYQRHPCFSTVDALAKSTPAEESVMADIYLGTVFSNRYNIRHFPGDMLTDRIVISNRFMGNPVALLAMGGLGYKSTETNPCFWFLSRNGTVDPRQDYMARMRWMEAEGCGFPPWSLIADPRASGDSALFIPAGSGCGDRMQTTPLLFLPPGNYTYRIRLRAAGDGRNQPVVVLVARELLPNGEGQNLVSQTYNTALVQNRSSYQELGLDFEVKNWGLTCLSINFGKFGSFWWDGVGVDGIDTDFSQLFSQIFVRHTAADAICLYSRACISSADPLFAHAIAIDDEFQYKTICRWQLNNLDAGDYWIWYVDDMDRDTAFYNWAEAYAVSVDGDGREYRRRLATLDIERDEWTTAPNLHRFKAHLYPGEWIEIDANEGFPAKVILAKLWIMRDMPLKLDYYIE
jgi:uncharacterized membrane protein